VGLDTGLDVVHDVGLPQLAYVEVSCSNNFFLVTRNSTTLNTFSSSWRTRSPLFLMSPSPLVYAEFVLWGASLPLALHICLTVIWEITLALDLFRIHRTFILYLLLPSTHDRF